MRAPMACWIKQSAGRESRKRHCSSSVGSTAIVMHWQACRCLMAGGQHGRIRRVVIAVGYVAAPIVVKGRTSCGAVDGSAGAGVVICRTPQGVPFVLPAVPQVVIVVLSAAVICAGAPRTDNCAPIAHAAYHRFVGDLLMLRGILQATKILQVPDTLFATPVHALARW